MSDAHLHLVPHSDAAPVEPDFSRERIEQYLEAAAGRGIGELCFTEHYYRCVEGAPYLGEFWVGESPDAVAMTLQMLAADRSLSLDAYVGAVLAAKDHGLPVRLGLELDVFPDSIERVADHLAGYPFDFVLGSVHWLGGLVLDTRDSPPLITARGLRRTWEEYTEVVEHVAESGVVDAIGHVDLLKKYGLRLPEEPLDLYERMVAALAASGVALEINSAGLRKPVGELYPAPTLLAMAHAAGVAITLGSDGHAPDEAGLGLDEAVAAAREAGYTEYLRFVGRDPQRAPLPRATA